MGINDNVKLTKNQLYINDICYTVENMCDLTYLWWITQ